MPNAIDLRNSLIDKRANELAAADDQRLLRFKNDAVALGSVTGLVYELDSRFGVFSDAGITAVTDGQLLHEWQDQTASGIDVIQATSADKPTWTEFDPLYNNQPSLEFDGVSDILKALVSNFRSADTTGTFIIVWNPDTLALAGALFGASSETQNTRYVHFNDDTTLDTIAIATHDGATGDSFSGSNVNLTTEAQISVVQSNGSPVPR